MHTATDTSLLVNGGPQPAAATQATLNPISPVVIGGIVRGQDCLLVTAAGVVIAWLYVGAEAGVLMRYGCAAGAASLLMCAINSSLGLYAIAALRLPLSALMRLLAGWVATAIAVVLAVFLLKAADEVSRVWLMSWFGVVALGLGASRITVCAQVRRWTRDGRLDRRAVIYGSGSACAELVLALEADRNSDLRICGVFDDRGGDRSGLTTAGYPNMGRLDDMIAFARHARVDMVLLALPVSAETRLMELQQRMLVLPADIRLAATASRLKLARRAYAYAGNVALIALADKPISDWGMIAKNVFDKIVAVVALVLLAPLMAATAIAIRLDSKGPALFRQKRYGFNNELIEVYKFRSMYAEMTDHAAAKLVTKDDPRVTRVGKFIRRTSIDELPQLFNVLLGTLSMVGPRPHAVSAKAAGKLYDEAVDSYFARHKVKPGITGWAQINGWRGETDTEEKLVRRIEHDIEYIENWSLLLDVWILARTPLSLVKSQNAY